MTLKWIGSERPLKPSDFDQIEDAWEVSLPEDYKECAQLYHGCVPEKNVITVTGWGRTQFQGLRIVKRTDQHRRKPTVMETWDRLKGLLGRGVFPFGGEPGGNVFCFRYSDKCDTPEIVFWYHEGATSDRVFPVCGTFSEFLELLEEG